MFENLESRQFMSVTLMTSETAPTDAQPTTAVAVDATAKVKVSDIHIVKTYDKSSPTLMM